jgi:hypothetical protein
MLKEWYGDDLPAYGVTTPETTSIWGEGLAVLEDAAGEFRQ